MKNENLTQKTDISACLNSLSIHEVRNLARAVGIARPATFKKGELIEKIIGEITAGKIKAEDVFNQNPGE